MRPDVEVAPLADRIEEDIAEGILAQALTVDFTRSFHDTTLCATFIELVAATHSHPYVIHTRMEATEEAEVTTMELVVTDADDWVFGAAEYLTHTQAEDWSEIPVDQRDTREDIQAAAEAQSVEIQESIAFSEGAVSAFSDLEEDQQDKYRLVADPDQRVVGVVVNSLARALETDGETRGTAVIDLMRNRKKDLKIVVYTMRESLATVSAVYEAGAKAFVQQAGQRQVGARGEQPVGLLQRPLDRRKRIVTLQPR